MSISRTHEWDTGAATYVGEFGQWLSKERKARDLTQEELAERLGCSVWAIQKIEVGKRRPSKQVADMLAHFFQVPPEEREAFLRFARGRADEFSDSPATAGQQSEHGVLDNQQATVEHPTTPHSSGSANNLPMQLTSFVGRTAEVPRIRDLMLTSEVRLLTLTGPPGTGKTRLALQVAAQLLNDFQHGVFFVNLAPITDPDLVISEIAQNLGVRESGGRSLLDGVKAHLGGKRVLLELDNFEQVVEAAPLVGELLTTAPGVKVMATSRVPLHIRGEKEFAVPPLQLPDVEHLPSVERLTWYEALRLFTERAKDVEANFELTGDNAPAVAQICAKLDGLPLAIELAAARVKVLPLEAILTRLDSRLKLLTGGPRDLPARQRTLRAAIEWSHDLLDEDERKLFRRLGVFQGGRSLEAIEAVCNLEGLPEASLLDIVSSLVDKGLLKREAVLGRAPRFVMLETIHEFAREKLEESGEEEEFAKRHALYFMTLAEEGEPHLRGQEELEWLTRLDEEHDNFRAALRWSQGEGGDAGFGLRIAAVLGRYWITRSYLPEGRQWMLVTLARTSARERTSTRGKALLWDGWFALFQGEYDRSRSLFEESLSILREGAEKQYLASALDGIGEVEHYQGNYLRAIQHFDEWLSISRELNDIPGLAQATLFLGYSELRLAGRHDFTGPLARLEEALVLTRRAGGAYHVAEALRMVGEIEVRQGNYDRAESLVKESLGISVQLGHKWGTACCLGTLGWSALLQGNYPRATQLLNESLSARQEMEDKGGIAWCLEWLAATALAEAGEGGEIARAERAATLLGTASVLRKAAGSDIDAADMPAYERSLSLLHVRLSGEAFEKAWQEGQAMSLEQAIAYALHDQDIWRTAVERKQRI